MNISLQSTYRSLHPFVSDELNDFTIITGKNGSGKSQLLSRFDPNSSAQHFQRQRGGGGYYDGNINADIKIVTSELIKKIQVEGIVKDNSTQINYENWKNIVGGFLQNYR